LQVTESENHKLCLSQKSDEFGRNLLSVVHRRKNMKRHWQSLMSTLDIIFPEDDWRYHCMRSGLRPPAEMED